MTIQGAVLINVLIFNVLTLQAQSSFKAKQLTSPRVKIAYEEKEKGIKAQLKSKGFSEANWKMMIRVFKKEAQMEVFISKNTSESFSKVFEFAICSSSGTLGPKRKEGDGQVPEGFYHINCFNPFSNYYLSLGINYPNASDKVLSDKGKPGGSIFIHGNCVTIGCMPITDEFIKELYVLCVEATANGQEQIPVYIFPFRMTEANMQLHNKLYASNTTLVAFWKNLKEGYDFIGKYHRQPTIKVNSKGKYNFTSLK